MPSRAVESDTVAPNDWQETELKAEALHEEVEDKQTARYAADQPVVIDAETNRRLFWKINRRILVVQLITYFWQSLDKGTLSFASIMGIKEDAHLVGQQVRFQSQTCNNF